MNRSENDIFERINWENGMDIDANDLIMTENFFLNSMYKMKQTSLPAFGYGLLPDKNLDTQDQGTDMEVYHTVTDKVEIRVNRCLGVTRSGFIVDYKAGVEDNMSLKITIPAETIRREITGKANRWNILLTVSPYERVLSGAPDNATLPPRFPYVKPSYTLSLSPIERTIISANVLILGRLRMEGERFLLDYTYIPPCTSLTAHAELIRYYRYFGQMFNSIEKSSKDIVAKVINRSDSSPIAINTSCICKSILHYTAMCFFEYRNLGMFWHPAKMIDCYSSLAHICFNSLNFLEKTEKEDLMQYFYEWSDISPVAFESLMNEAIDIEYEHTDLQSAFFIIEKFLKALSELWQMLVSLDYIGRHKDNIVIGERKYSDNRGKSTEWTPFDRM